MTADFESGKGTVRQARTLKLRESLITAGRLFRIFVRHCKRFHVKSARVFEEVVVDTSRLCSLT